MAKDLYSEDQGYLVKQLKKARISAGLSQSEVANKFKKTQSHISKIESGQSRVDFLQLKKLASLYKRSLDFFVKE